MTPNKDIPTVRYLFQFSLYEHSLLWKLLYFIYENILIIICWFIELSTFSRKKITKYGVILNQCSHDVRKRKSTLTAAINKSVVTTRTWINMPLRRLLGNVYWKLARYMGLLKVQASGSICMVANEWTTFLSSIEK